MEKENKKTVPGNLITVAEKASAARWLPASIGIVAAMAAVILHQALIGREHNDIKNTIQIAAESMRHDTEERMSSLTLALVRMAKRWELSRKPVREEWEHDANLYMAHFSGYVAVEWIDPAFQTQWSAPKNGIREKEYGEDEKRRITSGIAQKWQSVAVHSEGDQLRIYTPIGQGSDFKGFIVGVFSLKDSFDSILHDPIADNYSFRIFHGNIEVYSHVFAGGRGDEEWGHEIKIAFNGLPLRMVVWPHPEQLNKMLTPLPGIVVGMGLFLSLLLSTAIFFAQKARLRTKEVEAARHTLQESEEHLKDAQRLAHVGSWELDLVNNFLIWSDEIYRIFEIDPRRFGASYEAFLDAIHHEDRDMVNAAYTNSLESRLPYSIDHRLLFPDGRIKHVHERCETFYDKDGNPIRSAGTVQDITDRKMAEDLINRQSQELARSNEELEKFAYVASHDLQEPLRTIGSFTQLLARKYKGKLDSDADEFISFIVDGASRMQGLINDLLAYSRVGLKGKEFEPTDFEVLLEHVLANLKTAIDGSGAVITHDPLPSLYADPTQMEQLFQNLISNAIKFRGEEQPRVRVSAGKKKHEWVFSFRDNGIGIEQDYFDRIFIIFQRLHGKSEYSGTGIGLAVCKKIVERHGGRIWVESEKGKGSTFYFTIPVKGGK